MPSHYDGSKVLDCRHSDWADKINDWELIERALGSGSKWTKEALDRFDCESDGSFALRTKRALDAISVNTPLESMQGVARGSFDQARIENASDRVTKICNEDFDGQGMHWYNWAIDHALLNTPAYGEFWIAASSPSNLSKITLAEEKDNEPFVFGRKPLQILNFTYENGNTKENGQFKDILFITSEMSLNEETGFNFSIATAVRMTRTETTIFATTDCRAFNIDGVLADFSKGNPIRSMPTPGGIVPFRRVDIGGSIIFPVVQASAQAMNIWTGCYISTFDEGYNQKWTAGEQLPDDFTTGSTSVIQFTNADSKFNITDAPKGAIENAIKFLDHEQRIVDIKMQNNYRNLATKGGPPSGDALVQMNSSQAQAVGYQMGMIGDALQDVIGWMHILTGEAIPEDLNVIMPSSYEATTQKDAVENTLDMQDVEALSEEGLKVKITNKWKSITPPEELEEVVKAELAAELIRLNATTIIDAASAASGDTLNQFGGDTINQDSGDALNQENEDANGN